jgi:hypothetical protein
VPPYNDHGTNNGTHACINGNQQRNAGQSKMKATVSVMQQEVKAGVRANNEGTKATINPIRPGLRDNQESNGGRLLSVDQRTRGLPEEFNEDWLPADPLSTHC